MWIKVYLDNNYTADFKETWLNNYKEGVVAAHFKFLDFENSIVHCLLVEDLTLAKLRTSLKSVPDRFAIVPLGTGFLSEFVHFPL